MQEEEGGGEGGWWLCRHQSCEAPQDQPSYTACIGMAHAMARAREGSVSAGAGTERTVRRGLEDTCLSPSPSLTFWESLWQKLDVEWDGSWQAGKLSRQIDIVGLGELCSLGGLPGGRGFGTGLAYF